MLANARFLEPAILRVEPMIQLPEGPRYAIGAASIGA
jgi:hypothetical protein